jgi:CheY-like chemotaxis protein
MMPVMNGYDATRAIRTSAHPEATTIPIVAMTANAYREDVEMAMEAGMNAHVAKPIDIEVLLSVLEEYRTASVQDG